MALKKSRLKVRKPQSRAKRSVATRREFDRLRSANEELRGQVARHQSDLDLQFKRCAQIQAELEALQRTVRKIQRN